MPTQVENVHQAVRHIPADSDELLALVRKGTTETQALVLKVLSIQAAAGPRLTGEEDTGTRKTPRPSIQSACGT